MESTKDLVSWEMADTLLQFEFLGIVDPAEQPYKCAHTILKSHAMAYRIYESEFKETQGGKCGITIDSGWYEPASDKPEDIEAAERAVQFKVNACE